jgi:hypothetical protein
MVAANPPLILNNTTSDPQLTSNYNPMAYPSYGNNASSNTTSSATASSANVQSLYSYNLPSDENARYWNINKRQDNTKR